LPDAAAEAAIAGSMARYGQISPLAVCLREERPEVLDGFKRIASAKVLPAVTSLQARLLEVDEPTAKAIILGLNGIGGRMKELEEVSLEGFDWAFNVQAIDRIQIEALATGEFIRRGDNLVIAGQSGVGKSRILQSVGRAACARGYRVRYTTSADLLRDLTASLADHTLPQQLRYYANFDLLAIDEFGFDKIERAESSQAASLLYKVVDSRGPKRSTAMVTNISFEAWADYLGDAPLAMAILDRLVDGAIVLKIEGRSYRASRVQRLAPGKDCKAAKRLPQSTP
jgi:DNA replication protein DnaC